MTKMIAIVCLAALCGACGSESRRPWDANLAAGASGAAGSAGLAGASAGLSGSSGATQVVAVSGAGGEVATQVVAGMGGAVQTGAGGAGTSDGPGDGGTVADTGGATGTGGAEVCECTSGLCCDGCHYLGSETVCFFGTWSYCEPDDDMHCTGQYYVIDSIRQTVFCTGLSPMCVTVTGSSLMEATRACCGIGSACQQLGEHLWVDPNAPPAVLPSTECI